MLFKRLTCQIRAGKLGIVMLTMQMLQTAALTRARVKIVMSLHALKDAVEKVVKVMTKVKIQKLNRHPGQTRQLQNGCC